MLLGVCVGPEVSGVGPSPTYTRVHTYPRVGTRVDECHVEERQSAFARGSFFSYVLHVPSTLRHWSCPDASHGLEHSQRDYYTVWHVMQPPQSPEV